MEPKRNMPTVLLDVFQTGQKIFYEKGEFIIRQEDEPRSVYFITSGYVKSFDITKYGEENLLVLRGTGNFFPIIWTMINERTAVYYQALTDVEVYRIDQEQYHEMLDKNRDFMEEVLEQVIEMYHIHSDRILNLEYRSAAERIAFRLLTLSRRFGYIKDNKTFIDIPQRHQDIAASINCSRETASRELSKLEKKGIICTIDGRIAIKDSESLRRIVSTD